MLKELGREENSENQSNRQELSVTISTERTRDISRRGFGGKQSETV
jgi:hypothetical protein